MRATFSQWLTIAIVFLLHNSFAVATASQCNPAKGQLSSLEGTVEIGHGGKEWQPGKLDAPLCEDDSIRVGPNSRAAIALIGDVVLRLDQNTTVRLVDLTEKPEERSVIELLIGALQSFSRAPRKLAVNTPYINGMIEGTEFLTRVESDRASITVFEGKVIAGNDLGNLALTHGQSAEALQGQAPQPRILARPRDAVQWALYYPPILDFRPDEFAATSDWQGNVRRSIEFYLKGNLQKAFELIASVPDTTADPRFFAYRASLFLAVGRVDKAAVDIERVLHLKPGDSNALALQTIIKVVQNQPGQALDVANKAVKFAPDSTAALMALSYAQQSTFDLKGARASLESIVKLEPQNALAWARLAELHSSFGQQHDALKAAEKAAALEPSLSRTQTVLGFSYLMQTNTLQAKKSFNKAISLEPSDPLPRLGLGLAMIRDGNLPAGRREIEIAAGMDPNNSIIRSYLGKAYFAEKRTSLTEREYETAKELDPNDPTPFFYDAIQKQTTNRPVEALQDIQKAIELNDNRAVYRSRLLLDSDLAARSASLARVYSDLGFQELALRQGWKSVSTDPGNFSAHRFLADSYSALPRHEIARVSELLQSQLLQPLNMTPIQPRLSESNLFLISAGGPGALSFNEFNPIFNRDGLTFQTSGLAGENNTYSGEEVVAGIYDKASFSLGYSKFKSDGWRANANQEDAIGNAFFQYEFTPQTSIQTEYRYRNRSNGDLELRFFPDDFRHNYEENEERNSIRLGLHHAFAPNSDILGSFMYQHRSTSSQDRPNEFITLIDEQFPDQQALSGEIQHLFRSNFVNLTSGIGYFDINAKREQTLEFLPELSFLNQQTTTSEDAQHLNLYLYSYLNLLKNVTFTLGGSGDIFRTDSTTTNARDQFNPKFGVSWNILPNTTFRAAAFRAMKRTLITDQTLEPTQVAGFNQFYDDINTTDSWRYGGAIDQKFSSTVFGGVEFSMRELNIPFQLIDVETGASQTNRGNGDEYLGRAYLFWTPHQWVAFNAEYQYEQFKNDAEVAFDYEKLTTDRVSLGVNLFHHSGLSASLKGSYFDQNGDFIQRGLACCEYGEDNFWVVDAAVSYRLPKRYGFIKVGANNVLDQNFNYFDTSRGVTNRNPLIIPDRVVFGSITLAIP